MLGPRGALMLYAFSQLKPRIPPKLLLRWFPTLLPLWQVHGTGSSPLLAPRCIYNKIWPQCLCLIFRKVLTSSFWSPCWCHHCRHCPPTTTRCQGCLSVPSFFGCNYDGDVMSDNHIWRFRYSLLAWEETCLFSECNHLVIYIDEFRTSEPLTRKYLLLLCWECSMRRRRA